VKLSLPKILSFSCLYKNKSKTKKSLPKTKPPHTTKEKTRQARKKQKNTLLIPTVTEIISSVAEQESCSL